MDEIKEIHPAMLETSTRAYDIVRIYSELWQAIRYELNDPDQLDEAVIQALTGRFAEDIRSVFTETPTSELIPAVGQAFADMLLLWIRDAQKGPWVYPAERSRSVRRPRSRHKLTGKKDSDDKERQA